MKMGIAEFALLFVVFIFAMGPVLIKLGHYLADHAPKKLRKYLRKLEKAGFELEKIVRWVSILAAVLFALILLSTYAQIKGYV